MMTRVLLQTRGYGCLTVVDDDLISRYGYGFEIAKFHGFGMVTINTAIVVLLCRMGQMHITTSMVLPWKPWSLPYGYTLITINHKNCTVTKSQLWWSERVVTLPCSL